MLPVANKRAFFHFWNVQRGCPFAMQEMVLIGAQSLLQLLHARRSCECPFDNTKQSFEAHWPGKERSTTRQLFLKTKKKKKKKRRTRKRERQEDKDIRQLPSFQQQIV
jgi:hypothetical protein